MDKATNSIETISKSCIAVRLRLLNRVVTSFYDFLAKERSLLWALLRRRIRIKGSPKLLVAFGKCFPS